VASDLARRKRIARTAEKLSARSPPASAARLDRRAARARVGVVGSNGGTPETRAVVDAADLVVFVGCAPARSLPSAGAILRRKAKIIHSTSIRGPGTNYRVDVPLIGDARFALRL